MRRSISPATLAAAGIMQTPDISAFIGPSIRGRSPLNLLPMFICQFIFYLFAIYFLFKLNEFSLRVEDMKDEG